MAARQDLRHAHPQLGGGAGFVPLQTQAAHVEMLGREIGGRLVEPGHMHGGLL